MSELRGFKELDRKLNELSAKTKGKTLRSALMSSSLPVLRAAQANAPVSDRNSLRRTYKGRLVAPGFLSRNINRKSLVSRDKSFVRVMVGPEREAFYGSIFVELGTSKMPAQPWLTPALESNQREVVARFKALLKKKIDQAAR